MHHTTPDHMLLSVKKHVTTATRSVSLSDLLSQILWMPVLAPQLPKRNFFQRVHVLLLSLHHYGALQGNVARALTAVKQYYHVFRSAILISEDDNRSDGEYTEEELFLQSSKITEFMED
jgi:hypothetical protein